PALPGRPGSPAVPPAAAPYAIVLLARGRDRTRSGRSRMLKVGVCLGRRCSVLPGHAAPQIADRRDVPDSVEALIDGRELAADFFHDGAYVELIAARAQIA